MDARIRLAIVVNSFPTLSETFIFNKVKGLTKDGLDVTVFTGSRQNDMNAFSDRMDGISSGQIRFSFMADGVAGVIIGILNSLFTHPVGSVRLLFASIRTYPKLRRSLKAFLLALPLKLGHYDIIHFEFSGLAVTYLDALPLLKPCKLLTSCRGAAEQIIPLVDLTRGDRLRQVFASMDRVHCVSHHMQKTVEKYGLKPGQAFVNHPAIDLEKFHRETPYPGKSSGPYRLISVGRLHWKKGLEFGLIAVRRLLDERYDVEYEIIGGGPELEKIIFLIHDMGLTGKVQLIGRQDAIKVRYALENADICLLPSLSEGLSNAVLEAMAMEIPVVSTTAGGMEEAIADGQEGFLVPPYRPDLMAEKVILLIKNSMLRVRIGQEGRKRVEKDFKMDSQIKKFINEYKQLIN